VDLLSDWFVGLSIDLFLGCTNLVHVYFCCCRRPWWCRPTLGRGEYKAKRKKKLILSFGNYLLSLLQVVRENLEHTRNLTHLRWEWWRNLNPCCCKRNQIPRDLHIPHVCVGARYTDFVFLILCYLGSDPDAGYDPAAIFHVSWSLCEVSATF